MNNEERKWPLMGYAPGGYMCHCISCKITFEGHREAYECLPCAEKAQAEWEALTPEQQEERVKKNIKTFMELLSKSTFNNDNTTK